MGLQDLQVQVGQAERQVLTVVQDRAVHQEQMGLQVYLVLTEHQDQVELQG
jgi:hypothetical protein